jgi:hypothetical protein
MILCGYFLGLRIPHINQNIHYVIGVVIFLSVLPAIISLLRARFSGSSRPPSIATPVRSERD